ncbi:MAG: SipW-dependent-type signal peptide-containing protein [Propionibacteriaceae bacterium]|jgi:predicted ribosomally synthesized peptide with SipW-like signal peptide|nr:SipW-dependent-type signal peptide-containing protein [Propionibacteriaceae bacterium]
MSQFQDSIVVVVEEEPRKRRFGALFAVLSLTTALGVGATLAAFTDSEYAKLNDATPFQAAAYNLQISASGEDGNLLSDSEWHDTSLDGQVDNTTADTELPLQLNNLGSNNLIPGDANAFVSTPFWIRNDPNMSTVNTKLALKLVTDSSESSDATMLAALRFKITVGTAQVENPNSQPDGLFTFAELNNTGVDLLTSLAPGRDGVKVTIDVSIADQGSNANNNALQGKQVYLIAQVNGESVV